jgi:hypothetical protein
MSNNERMLLYCRRQLWRIHGLARFVPPPPELEEDTTLRSTFFERRHR